MPASFVSSWWSPINILISTFLPHCLYITYIQWVTITMRQKRLAFIESAFTQHAWWSLYNMKPVNCWGNLIIIIIIIWSPHVIVTKPEASTHKKKHKCNCCAMTNQPVNLLHLTRHKPPEWLLLQHHTFSIYCM